MIIDASAKIEKLVFNDDYRPAMKGLLIDLANKVLVAASPYYIFTVPFEPEEDDDYESQHEYLTKVINKHIVDDNPNVDIFDIMLPDFNVVTVKKIDDNYYRYWQENDQIGLAYNIESVIEGYRRNIAFQKAITIGELDANVLLESGLDYDNIMQIEVWEYARKKKSNSIEVSKKGFRVNGTFFTRSIFEKYPPYRSIYDKHREVNYRFGFTIDYLKSILELVQSKGSNSIIFEAESFSEQIMVQANIEDNMQTIGLVMPYRLSFYGNIPQKLIEDIPFTGDGTYNEAMEAINAEDQTYDAEPQTETTALSPMNEIPIGDETEEEVHPDRPEPSMKELKESEFGKTHIFGVTVPPMQFKEPIERYPESQIPDYDAEDNDFTQGDYDEYEEDDDES